MATRDVKGRRTKPSRGPSGGASALPLRSRSMMLISTLKDCAAAGQSSRARAGRELSPAATIVDRSA